MRLSIAAGCALVTAAALPPRLWKAQLQRLGLLALLLFVLTALASGEPNLFYACYYSSKPHLPPCQVIYSSLSQIAGGPYLINSCTMLPSVIDLQTESLQGCSSAIHLLGFKTCWELLLPRKATDMSF